jgi:hypothetical protein
MRIYTCILSVVLPSLINTILNILIFLHVRASTRRILADTKSVSINVTSQQQPQQQQLQSISVISHRELVMLRQMIFIFIVFITGWSPVFVITIIRHFVSFDTMFTSMAAILSQLCILTIIFNLFLYNHELRDFLLSKFRQCI